MPYRLIAAILLLLLPLTAFGQPASSPYFADRSADLFNEDNKHVLDVFYKDMPLGRVVAYENRNGLMLPFGALTYLLGFHIATDPREGKAFGYMLKEYQSFSFSLAKKEVIFQGTKYALPSGITASDKEIYMGRMAFSKLIPIDIAVSYSKDRLSVRPASGLEASEAASLTASWSRIIASTTPVSPKYQAEKVVEQKTPVIADTAHVEVKNIPAGKLGKEEPPPPPQASTVVTSPASPKAEVPSVPADATSLFSGKNLLALQPVLDDFTYDDLLEAYRSGGHVFLPLEGLARLLDLAIEVDAPAGKAEGWFIKESHTLALDVKKQQVIVDGNSKTLAEGTIFTNDNDIFVDIETLSTWFPIKFTANIKLQTLSMKAREPLPVQEKQKRGKNWERQKNTGTKTTAEYPLKETPYKPYSIPFADITLSQSYNSASDADTYLTDFSLHSAGDIGYLSTQTFLSGTHKELSNARFTAGRNDLNAKLLGPLNASSFALGDIDISAIPLLTTSSQGRGVTLTNRPLTLPTQFDVTEFVGTDQPGWDVELYRNTTLLDFQQIGADGRYRFTNIPIVYGDNTFRLVFYGPQGQMREEVRRIETNDTLLTKGAFTYLFSADEKEHTLFGVGDVPDQTDGVRVVSDVQYGISSRLTGHVGVMQLPLKDATHRYGTAGFISSLPGGILARTDIAQDLEQSGTAENITLLASVFDISVKGQYRMFQDFVSEETEKESSPLKNSAELDLNRQLPFLPSVSTGANVKRDTFVTGMVRTALMSRVSASFFSTNLTNTLGVTETESEGLKDRTVNGTFASNIIVRSIALRASANYTLPDGNITNINAIAQKRLRDNLIGTLSYSKDLTTSDLQIVSASLNLDLAKAKLSFRADINSENALFLGTNLSFSIGREPRSGSFFVTGSNMAGLGAVSSRAFLDKNYNQHFDGDDEWLNDAATMINGRSIAADSNGIMFSTGLIADQTTDIVLDETTFKDPLYTSPTPGVSVTPHPGSVSMVDFPVIMTSEIEGKITVQKAGEKKPAPGAEIQLVDTQGNVVKKIRAEFDGYYLITRITPGEYVVRVAPDVLEKRKAQANSHTITVTAKGDVFSGQDIEMVPVELRDF